jgi:hypothetical protein
MTSGITARKDYAEAAFRGQHMQLGFLQHALAISRFHFCLETACSTLTARVELAAWLQGSELAGHKVEVAAIKASRQGNDDRWAGRLPARME